MKQQGLITQQVQQQLGKESKGLTDSKAVCKMQTVAQQLALSERRQRMPLDKQANC